MHERRRRGKRQADDRQPEPGEACDRREPIAEQARVHAEDDDHQPRGEDEHAGRVHRVVAGPVEHAAPAVGANQPLWTVPEGVGGQEPHEDG